MEIVSSLIQLLFAHNHVAYCIALVRILFEAYSISFVCSALFFLTRINTKVIFVLLYNSINFFVIANKSYKNAN